MRQFFSTHRSAFRFIYEKMFLANKKYFFWSGISMLVSSVMAIFLPYLAKLEMDQLAEQKTELFGIPFSSPIFLFAFILVAVFVFEILDQVIRFLFDLKTRVLQEMMGFDLKKEIYSRIYTIDPWYSLMSRFERMIESMRYAITGFPNTLSGIISGSLQSLIELWAIIVIVSIFDWKIFLVLFLSSLVNYGIGRFSDFLEKKYEIANSYEVDWEMRTIEHAVERDYHHITSNGATDMLFDRYFSLKNKQIHITRKQELVRFWSRILTSLSSNIATILVKLLVGYLIFRGTGSIGLMTLTVAYMGRVSHITGQVFQIFQDRHDLVEKISILEFFLDFIREKTRKRWMPLALPPKHIVMKDVSFSYPKPAQAEVKFFTLKIATLKKLYKRYKDDYYEDEIHAYEEARREAMRDNPEILHTINLDFQKGSLYGIVGKNGAGKTTLTSLLLGFFSEYTGNILVDGVEFASAKRTDIHKLVSYVSQEPYIMEGRFTIRDNLTLGVHREVSDAELYEYLDMFDLGDKIRNEREWLNTRLRYDMNLSGGQRQILALIRVILQDRSVLILDEGTNQLDAENEMRVMNLLLKNRREKIIIFVTHRMSTMKKCDFVYTIADGYIEDQGTPAELAKRENAYSHFLAITEQAF